MCGIAGFWQPADGARLDDSIRRMADTLRHRGPDDEGLWWDEREGVALGFRRLAIIDLSPLGRQPMVSVENRYTIVFNGEIYNYLDLKAELAAAGHAFRGHSDTEVILAGFSHWGIERTLRAMNGMFAIAVWDAQSRRLTLARDRIGKKPVYYARCGDSWVFASELKAIRSHPRFTPAIDRDALAEFLRFSYVPAPRSIYQGVRKLLPGHFLTLSRDGDATPESYWDVAAVAREGQSHPAALDAAAATSELEALLRDAVARRMISDVPLGAFLSGGLDSSTIVALMQAQSATPVKTFTIGFDVAGYDEAQAAKAVARHLGTEHTELYVTPEQALAVIPQLPQIYDEPFADSSQIPTYLVSKLAREHVTVSLSGDGGDELFAGYNRYAWGPGIWNKVKYLPPAARRMVGAVVQGTPPELIDRIYSDFEPALPPSWRMSLPGDKLHKLAGVISVTDQMEIYSRLVSAWHHPETIVAGGHRSEVRPWSAYLPDGFRERMMYRDLVTYLPDDILVKVDRASMAVSLEVRAPLLDYRIIEWAWRLPPGLRMHQGQSKWLLRQVLYRHVPPALVDRPKAGFGVPIDHWLRGPLREWAEDLLSVAALEEDGLLRAEPIRQVWQRHLAGHRNEHTRLWPILMFQAWRRQWAV
jgi:asparagine synthase (glutamine-hydrolysing)